MHGKVKTGIGVQSPPEAYFVIGLYGNWCQYGISGTTVNYIFDSGKEIGESWSRNGQENQFCINRPIKLISLERPASPHIFGLFRQSLNISTLRHNVVPYEPPQNVLACI